MELTEKDWANIKVAAVHLKEAGFHTAADNLHAILNKRRNANNAGGQPVVPDGLKLAKLLADAEDILNDGPDDSDRAHANGKIIEAINLAHAMLSAAPVAQAVPDTTDDECIELAEALCWEAMRNALAGTRNAASLLEDGQFRNGMETACDEIETRLGLSAAKNPDDKGGSEG